MSIIQDLHTVSNDAQLSFAEKLQSLLKIGCNILGLEAGIVSSIQGKRYQVLAAYTADSSIEKGAVFDLCDTYCADVVATDAVVSYHNIDSSPGATHPCFEKFTLKSYLACPVRVNGEFFGTVNFSSTTSREAPFTSIELDYLLLLASWIGNELEKQQVIDKLKAQKTVLEERNSLLLQITNLA
ncbi:GAF domain-containing protein [Alteromonas gracilis]|uniref:GAF domain-containing protein n=1 Tax=Alteromonas gracilis TaxID=1479524 RepID=UPI0030D24657